jgi:hypothetical protein
MKCPTSIASLISPVKQRRSGRAFATVAATLLALALPAASAGADGLRPGPLSDEPIWTDRPVRVDRKVQTYERVKVERKQPSLTLRPSARVTVFDSASFQDAGRIYILTDAVAVNPKQLCRSDAGGVAACGQQARLFLKRLIAHRTLSCDVDFRAGTASFVTCRLGEADLAETLIAKGAATAARPRFAAVQERAALQAVGMWIDKACRSRGRCPPPGRR